MTWENDTVSLDYYNYDEGNSTVFWDYFSYDGGLFNGTRYILSTSEIISMVFLLLFALLSIVGNSLLLLILLKFKNLKSLVRAFLVNLAVSDLIFTGGMLCVVCTIMIPQHITSFHSLWETGVFCLCSGFFSSTLLLMMMSFHRYLLVLHPLSDPQSHDSRHGIAVSIITWTVSISAAVPVLNYHFHFVQLCIRMSIFLFFFLCVASLCFILIFKTSGERKDSTVRVIFSIVVVNGLVWTPFIILLITDCFILTLSLVICLLIGCSHSFLKPILYNSLEDKFRSYILSMCRKCRDPPPSVDMEMSSI